MTKSNTALIPAVVVTLVLHVAVVAAVRNRPLAVIDQSMLASQRRPFVVRPHDPAQNGRLARVIQADTQSRVRR